MSPSFHLHGAPFFTIPLYNWPALWGGAVYILGRRTPEGFIDILYVGQTSELRGYIGYGHHKWADASGASMNVLLVHWQPDQTKRLNLETILRHHYRPPLNDQLKANEPASFGGPAPPAYKAMVGWPPVNAMGSGLLPPRR